MTVKVRLYSCFMVTDDIVSQCYLSKVFVSKIFVLNQVFVCLVHFIHEMFKVIRV